MSKNSPKLLLRTDRLSWFSNSSNRENSKRVQMVGLIGLEPMTLRLSSACSNQLSYRPFFSASLLARNLKFQI